MSNAAADIVRTALAAGRASLTEQESKALLAHYGVPVPSGDWWPRRPRRSRPRGGSAARWP